jgi:hypothetical protein
MSRREESPWYATDIEAISPSEAAIAVDPIHAKRVPQTNDVCHRRQYSSDLRRESSIE